MGGPGSGRKKGGGKGVQNKTRLASGVSPKRIAQKKGLSTQLSGRGKRKIKARQTVRKYAAEGSALKKK